MMEESNVFANIVARKCHEAYERLPKSGKPAKSKEWTLLSSILVTTSSTEEPTLVSLTTGTKCLGQSKLSNKGNLLSDCHAEILSRRSFMRYMNNEIRSILNDENSNILAPNGDNKVPCSLKPEVKFHLYISYTPCGDASIFTKPTSDSVNKRPFDDDETNTPKRLKTTEKEQICTSDIYRTGAKCVPVEGNPTDLKLPGAHYHVVGTTRTKPGRGDPTISMSCSDKIAKWNVCGIQGALLSKFLDKPIYLSTVIIGSCPYDETALKRAIIDRNNCVALDNLPPGYMKASPILLQSNVTFTCSKHSIAKLNEKAAPSSSAIIWCNMRNKPLEICVDGRKQGVTLKNLDKITSWLSVCKYNLLKDHVELCKQAMFNLGNMEKYSDFKESAKNYQKISNCFKKSYVGWTEKPILLNEFRL